MAKVMKLLNGEPIAIYNSIGCAARAARVQYNRMQDVLHGRRTGTRGYTWRFATEEEIKKYGDFHVVKYLGNS